MRITSEPTTSEKVKDTALAVASLAIEKAGEAKEKTMNDIAPLVAEKAEAARDAAAPHVETARDVVAEKTAAQRAAALEQLESAKAVAASKMAEVQAQAEQSRKEAAKAAKKADKRADKKAGKLSKAADKKKDALAKKADKKYGFLEKKATKKYGSGPRQDVAFKAAALRGQASAFAEDKGITRDNARDLFNDELLPQVKELIASATAASAAATQSAVSRLPEGAQEQVVRYAPAAAPKKKKGRGLMVLGLGALGGAGYLFYMGQQKKSAADAQLSETAKADAITHSDEQMTINNPVTDFGRAEDPTLVRPAGADPETAEPAGAPGTAATWTEAEPTGHMTTEGLENPEVTETRSSRRQARGDV